MNARPIPADSIPADSISRTLRRTAGMALVALTALVSLLLATAPAVAQDGAPAAAPTGWVRLGHLSPDTPPVDVYLSSFGGPEQLTVRKASYGVLTDYATLTPGPYTVAMRPAGAPANSPAMLAWTVEIAGGEAYTVLAVGPRGELTSRVLTDELTPPAVDRGRVRLIQGAPNVDQVDVVAVGGPVLARNVEYGTATGYAEVPVGRWSLRIDASDGEANPLGTVDVRPGTVQSLLVLRGPNGGLEITPVVDGTGLPVAPAGGVETGAGGTAGSAEQSATLGLALLALLTGAVALTGRVAGLLPRRR